METHYWTQTKTEFKEKIIKKDIYIQLKFKRFIMLKQDKAVKNKYPRVDKLRYTCN